MTTYAVWPEDIDDLTKASLKLIDAQLAQMAACNEVPSPVLVQHRETLLRVQRSRAYWNGQNRVEIRTQDDHDHLDGATALGCDGVAIVSTAD